ncbi:BTAD domain-containing putative transcriptional regulator [uncultured Desulfosarcina sp.]|uniref:BTAD domain-containing putative transcriptional regulator n=1 Tax=uncultured Desulfosarcina sp. TaxID=218289 RepID=UPI0029C76EFB|nr:BTAD domain-containing putative transcriptional regulator [uncultured Desulfosarcina sp.]
MVDARTISRTTPPGHSRAIPRPRLIQRVLGADATRVILITGQAAQGKSTLAAELARQPGPTGAWMHLDPSDSDPVNFFHLLVHALKTSRPSLDTSAFLKNPAIALGTEMGSGRITELASVFLNEIIAQAPVRIVMDGLDRLSGNAESLKLIDRILVNLSPPSCLVLVSRETPPLKLEQLRIRQELVVLNNDDLAFTTDEIFRFFSDLYDLRLAPPQLARIREITDGWAGGLVLVWEALSHIPEAQRIDFIERGLPVAMQGDRLAYFSEAVFSALDETTRNFLIRSAIFDTIDPKKTASYLQNQPVGDVETILNTMVRQNLFIHRLSDIQSGLRYRYNQLFRDFLLDKFHGILDRAEQRELLVRAADLDWDSGNYEGAIRFFLQAEVFEKAAAGIKKIAMGLSAQGRFADLAGWIDILPDDLIHDDAWLSFYKAVGRRISGGRRNIEAFSRALDRFKAEGDQRGQLLALAYLIEAAVFIGHPAVVLNRWLGEAWTMLERVSGNRYYPFAKAVLWMQVAFGYLSGASDLQKGLSACRNAMLLANTIQDETLTVNTTIIHVFGLTLTGEFAAAEKALATIHHLVAAAYPEYRALKNIVSMKLSLSKGDLDCAQRLLDANQKDIDKFGLLFLYPIHLDLSGLLQIHQRRFDAVGHTTRHLKDVATLTANPFYNGLALRLRALKAYHQGHFERARRWAELAVGVIAQSLGESIHLFRCRLILGMAAYHLKDLAGARQALTSARDFFSRVSSRLSLAEACLGLSLVETAMGNRDAADRHLESALAVAASQGYEAFPILAARDIVAACTPALQTTHSEMARLARRLLTHLSLQPPGFALAKESDAGKPIQRPATTAGSDDTPAGLVIQTLGGFEVRRNGGEAIADAQWAGLRQKLLLKAILVNGCREIPKDILMDALWPDSTHEAALKRFKVTLHRLRRILEPQADQRAGFSCILLKDNLISLDMRRCQVDVNDFLEACDEIRQLKRDDDDERILSACRRAAAIYRGDFLPEEPYLSWAEMKRAALKDRYLAVLMEMVVLLERKGDLDEAARHCGIVIQADPLAEQAYQRLMRLLYRQGRRSAALKIYRDLVDVLAVELDTDPDPATTKIYHEIMHDR